MSKRNSRKKESLARSVTCNKCGASTVAHPGQAHRRCPGKMNKPPRPVGDQLVPAERGIWE